MTNNDVLSLARDIIDLLESSPLSSSEKVQAATVAEFWAINAFTEMRHKSLVLSGVQVSPYSREQIQLRAKNENWLQRHLSEPARHSQIQADTLHSESDTPLQRDIAQADNEDFYPRGHAPRG